MELKMCVGIVAVIYIPIIYIYIITKWCCWIANRRCRVGDICVVCVVLHGSDVNIYIVCLSCLYNIYIYYSHVYIIIY